MLQAIDTLRMTRNLDERSNFLLSKHELVTADILTCEIELTDRFSKRSEQELCGRNSGGSKESRFLTILLI